MKRILLLCFLIQAFGVVHSVAQEAATPSQYDIDYLLTVIDKQQRGIESLQAQIDQLNKKMEQLQTKLGKQTQLSPQRSLPAGVSVWRQQIKRGMTHAQVRRVLGEPKKISTMSNMDFWRYDNGGEVDFYDGKVYSFQEPQH